MKHLALLLLLATPAAASARPWNNINPGQSARAEVVKKFGEPSKKVKQGDMEVLAYIADQAIKGTTQAQFTVGGDGKVEQIVVFPAVTIDVSEVEDTYGRACSEVEKAGKIVTNCYVKQLTDDFRTYYWYKRLGLVIFFGDDKKTVYSLQFMPPSGGAATAAK